MTGAAPLERTLAAIAEAAPDGAEDWWIIGSTAMHLSGYTDVAPDDVDIFASRETAMGFLRYWKVEPAVPKTHPQFRSDPFTSIYLPGCLRIELMGNLEVKHGEAWKSLRLVTREKVHGVYIPSSEEQVAIFRLFGREKDLDKAARLVG
ncbi:hypothetical protein [Brucella sp. IR073]|uniref:hypothetical protein n=1 Tax=unclassified Brucella TaxID=2632610 RepID=UPI003B987DC5